MRQLYEAYPQLKDPNANACVRNYATQLMNLTYAPYDLMTMYGSMMLNDLGSYTQCEQIPGADYTIITGNISRVPI